MIRLQKETPRRALYMPRWFMALVHVPRPSLPVRAYAILVLYVISRLRRSDVAELLFGQSATCLNSHTSLRSPWYMC